ncbi:MAG TPA: S8 family serine peptidase [Nocardioides sp.]|nr:S8 family serine peptidase [Nocardioides sp.]
MKTSPVRHGSRHLTTCVAAALATASLVVATGPAGAQARSSGPSPSTGRERVIVVLHPVTGKGRVASPSYRAAVAASQAPVLRRLHAARAGDVHAVSVVNAITATVSPAEAAAPRRSAGVSAVVADAVLPAAATPSPEPASTSTTASPAPGPCGTASHPELDPEALDAIHATPSDLGADTGSGVTVAFLADGIDPAHPDLQRNAAFASAGSPAGSPVLTQVDFSGEGTAVPTGGGESFLDASSIAAQGNTVHDLSTYVRPAHPLPAGCDIRIVGAAPGASLLSLKVYGTSAGADLSNFVQAVDYAVSHGAKVVSESLAKYPLPDTVQDLWRAVDENAVAAGVTVVAGSGDAGPGNTIGSPGSDPGVITVGATTTLRSYAQTTYGGINAPGWNGRYADGNIASFSSGGFTAAGGTVDLVAPGDANWALCGADATRYLECGGYDFQQNGGTSESAPLVAAAAADVIHAYAATHGGNDPTPAQVEQVLTSTATDVDAPADEQGAGLLDVAAAIRLARSLPGTSTPSSAPELTVGPGAIGIEQDPGSTTSRTIHLANTSTRPVTVSLRTRAFTSQLEHQGGTFCLQPGTPTPTCPANTGVFTIWSGAPEVYQAEHFSVPRTTEASRLVVNADYRFVGQASLLHVALFEPDGTYAGYSDPNGFSGFADVEVADPPAGRWTAVFFTLEDGVFPAATGTSGPIDWSADVRGATPAGHLSATSLTIPPGSTATSTLSVQSPAAGDTSQAVVVTGPAGRTTIPVVVRTDVPTGPTGGRFTGVLTGGNGRAYAPAQTDSYAFDVPPGRRDLQVEVALAGDPHQTLTGFLVAPDGQALGESSNITLDAQSQPEATSSLDMYAADPPPGRWYVVLRWANPVSGTALQERFTGTVAFDEARVGTTLPAGHVTLPRGAPSTFTITVRNTGQSTAAYFVDPRLDHLQDVELPNLNTAVDAGALHLPVDWGASAFQLPYYLVPTSTVRLAAHLSGSVPVTFDFSWSNIGDPDISSALTMPGVTASQGGGSASVSLSASQVAAGLWILGPTEVGPYPAAGAPPATAAASVDALTAAFDPALDSSTGDMWTAFNGGTSAFAPAVVPSRQSTTITVTVTPTAAVGQTVHGTAYVETYPLGAQAGVFTVDADQLIALPYTYTVG